MVSKSRYGQLHWRDGHPFSDQFDDAYFSIDSGIEESRHVFLGGNQLAQRWQQLAQGAQFCIGETGFGSGLNFLTAAELWLATAPNSATLHFVSVEKYPLRKTDLRQVLSLWPQLQALCAELLANYPDHLEQDIYALPLAHGRIWLTLIVDDVAAGLAQQLHHQHPEFSSAKIAVDAWFLDGFAPSKNPEMWTQAVFSRVAALSHDTTTVATYSSAGQVRAGLTEAGFHIEKQLGYGHKLEMSCGRFDATAAIKLNPDLGDFKSATPWSHVAMAPASKCAIVIGAGLAGAHTARALADSGWQVTVLEAAATIASGASGNPQGAVYAKLSPKRQLQGRFNLQCLQFAQNQYRDFWRNHPSKGRACGVLQLITNEQQQTFCDSLYQLYPNELIQPLDCHHASQLAQVALQHGGAFYPQAGWINPPALCQNLLSHPSIVLKTGHCVTELEADRATQKSGGDQLQQQCSGWQVNGLNSEGSFSQHTALVVVCCAHQAKQFSQLQALPLKSIRGQITQIPACDASRKLATVITADGYIAPAVDNHHYLGATFTLHNQDPQSTSADNQANLALLTTLLPDYDASVLPLAQLQGRVGFRCTSPDYLPLVGPVPQREQMLKQYARLTLNARAVIGTEGAYHPNLLLNVAHGSRGLAYTPLCAHYIAALANASPYPIAQDLVQALSPARFVMREVIRTQNKRDKTQSSTLNSPQ